MEKTRLAAYITAFLAGVGMILSAMGWATYDAATGTIDLAPFNVYAVSGIVAPVLASGMAFVVLWWQGSRK